MLMIDLCCGLKGASEAFRQSGWDVITLDVDERFQPDIVADVRNYFWKGERPDFVWASPPCTDFARESMPWSRTGQKPDLSIFYGCLRFVDLVKPRFWVLENVRGSIPFVSPFLGQPRLIKLPYIFWGFFPIPSINLRGLRRKQSFSSSRDDLRSKIPLAVSRAFLYAIEHQPVLF